MPFEIECLDAGIWVGGYPDGSDWVSVPTGGDVKGAGIIGDAAAATRAWAVCGPPSGYGDLREIVILDLAGRRRVGRVALPKIDSDKVLASRNGQRVYAVSSRSEGTPGQSDFRLDVELISIDVVAGAIEKRIALPCAGAGLYRQSLVETDDGRIRLPVTVLVEKQGQGQRAIATVDTVSGEVEIAPLPNGGYYVWLSPRGRYALRPNLASLPVRDEASFTVAGFPVGPKTRFHAASLQLWEADPPRYVRTIPVAWLTYAELPDEARPQKKRAAYDAIIAACNSQPRGAVGAPPLTAERYSSDTSKAIVAQIHWAFAEQLLNDIVWSDDEQSFWASSHGFWSCATVDGAASPRLRLARTGMLPGMVVPFACGPSRIEPMTVRSARFVFSARTGSVDGSALVTAATPSRFKPVHVVPASSDGWRSLAFGRAAVTERIRELFNTATAARIPLAGLSADACIDAIDALAKDMPRLLKEHARQGSMTLVFDHLGASLDEAAFFGQVEANGLQAVPALRRLIGAAIEGPLGLGDPPWSDGGWQLLGPAVKALGVLDATALDMVEGYGRLLDPGHESYFAGSILPAVIKAHGWTDPMIDFGLWALLSEYPVLPALWRDWGMGAAMAGRTPAEACAAGILTAVRNGEEPEELYRFGHPRLLMLWKEIAPLTAYEEKMFAELDAATPNYDYSS